MDYFDNTWTLTEHLFASLQGEAPFYLQAYHHLRHPLIFSYGHVAALYVNKLRVAGLLSEPVNAHFEAQLGATDDAQFAAMRKRRLEELEELQSLAEDVAASGMDAAAQQVGLEWATRIGAFIA